MNKRFVFVMLLSVLAMPACARENEDATPASAPQTETQTKTANDAPSGPERPPFIGYRIVNEYPHDKEAFTQGLFFDDGVLYETTGLYGQSDLRRVDLETGKVEQIKDLPNEVFGEGSVAWGDNIVVLTWREGLGYLFNKKTFSKTKEFSYEGEGWGLTHDGERLIVSDGTSSLRFFDPQTLEQTGSLPISFRGRPLRRLNELEWIDGVLYANVYMTPAIVRIDPVSGIVTGVLDLSDLVPVSAAEQQRGNVLNGIAYDPDTKRFFVTGKNWPKLYEIELITPQP